MLAKGQTRVRSIREGTGQLSTALLLPAAQPKLSRTATSRRWTDIKWVGVLLSVRGVPVRSLEHVYGLLEEIGRAEVT